jgi:hypothetical protein
VIRIEISELSDARRIVDALLEKADREERAVVGDHTSVRRLRALADAIGDELDAAVPAPSSGRVLVDA